MLLAHPLQELRGEEVVANVGSAEGELAAALLPTLGNLLGYLGVLDHLESQPSRLGSRTLHTNFGIIILKS